MVDSALIATYVPLQRITGTRGRNAETVIDSRLDFRAFFVIVPGYELQRRQLFSGIVEAVDFGKSLQPGLSALLAHDAVRSPGGQRVVETFVGSAYGLLVFERYAGIVEAAQVVDSIVGRRGHDPGIAPRTQCVTESVIVLEEKHGLAGEGPRDGVPIHAVREVNVEIRDHRLALPFHVSGRRKIGLLDVLQLLNQSLLR